MPDTTERIYTPDFTTMFLTAGGTVLRQALADHRVLTNTLDHFIFVIAHTDDRTAALATAAARAAAWEGVRQVYTILLSDEHLTVLDDRQPTTAPDGPRPALKLNVAVLDAQNDHQPAPTAITVNNTNLINSTTEHGNGFFELVTSRDLRKGDLYTCGNRADNRSYLLYHATAAYDPTTGQVPHHIIVTGWDTLSDAQKSHHTGALTGGPDHLIRRLRYSNRLRTRLGMPTTGHLRSPGSPR